MQLGAAAALLFRTKPQRDTHERRPRCISQSARGRRAGEPCSCHEQLRSLAFECGKSRRPIVRL